MPYEQRDNSGAIFPNDRRREGKSDSDYTGDCTINGQKYWVNAWEKDGGRGKFFSLSFKPKQPKPATPAEPPEPAQPERPVPF